MHLKALNNLPVRLAVIILTGYMIWCILLFLKQDAMLFPKDLAGPPGVPPADAERILISPAPGEPVEAWFFPADADDAETPRPLVIYFHGNAELIDDQTMIVEKYRALGISVLLPEYRGYGRSKGTPGQKGIVSDAEAFYRAVIQKPGIDPERVIFHGRSLGGAVAAALAERVEPSVLILESTFSSTGREGLRYGVPPFLAKHPFRTDRVVKALDAPMLIFHGSMDRIISPKHGRRLRDLAGEKAVYVEYPCGHNDFPGTNEVDFWNQVEQFLRDAKVIL